MVKFAWPNRSAQGSGFSISVSGNGASADAFLSVFALCRPRDEIDGLVERAGDASTKAP
jgi:hypothetical protein